MTLKRLYLRIQRAGADAVIVPENCNVPHQWLRMLLAFRTTLNRFEAQKKIILSKCQNQAPGVLTQFYHWVNTWFGECAQPSCSTLGHRCYHRYSRPCHSGDIRDPTMQSLCNEYRFLMATCLDDMNKIRIRHCEKIKNSESAECDTLKQALNSWPRVMALYQSLPKKIARALDRYYDSIESMLERSIDVYCAETYDEMKERQRRVDFTSKENFERWVDVVQRWKNAHLLDNADACRLTNALALVKHVWFDSTNQTKGLTAFMEQTEQNFRPCHCGSFKDLPEDLRKHTLDGVIRMLPMYRCRDKIKNKPTRPS